VTSDAGSIAACKAAVNALPGMQLQHFTNPRSALKWAEKNEPVAVVVDQRLPSMDATTFVRRLHGAADALRPHVILVSSDPYESAATARDAGVDDILHTSAPRSSFVSLVQSAVGLRLAERALWDRTGVLEERAASAAEERIANAADGGRPLDAPTERPPTLPVARPRAGLARRVAVAAGLALLLVLLLGHPNPAHDSASIAAAPSAAPSSSSAHASDPSAPSPGGPVGIVAAASSPADGGLDAAVAAAVAAASSGVAAAKAAHAANTADAADATRGLGGDPNGGYLVLDATGQPLGASNADVARVPASTVKLVTAAAALATLGAGFRFSTELVAHGAIRDGVLDGTLTLVGGGDPVLSTADLDDAVALLARRGVRRIHGDLVIDATAFTAPEYNAGWSREDRSRAYAAGTSAISIDEGTLGGVSVRDQQTYAGLLLRRLLYAHGISVDGATRHERSPGGTVVWRHASPPLSTLTRTMLVESDNHIAEQILRETGLAASGAGSESAGIARLRSYLVERDVPTAGLRLSDGSGLSLDNRMTPRTLATLLWRIEGTPEGAQIEADLPHIGTSDDLIAKTGQVGTARGLSGYLERGPQAPLSFAALGASPPDTQPQALPTTQAQFIDALANSAGP
jgi:D-alanyl-D-alanine carboxypeptidase/D-alanyl-D-alanine-endopeptidase (penicillin-binding protein 4)